MPGIPREHSLLQRARDAAREVFPARTIRKEKQVEGEGAVTHASQHGSGGADALLPASIGAAGVVHSHVPLHNLTATAAPTASDDGAAGYGPGSRWIDVINDNAYVCVDAGVEAAIWRKLRYVVTADDDVAIPPTDAELDTAFGTPAAVGDGFIGILDDNGAGTAVYLCVAKNSAWWYQQLTEAT